MELLSRPLVAGALAARMARRALAVLLPVRCSGCGDADASVCDNCRARLAGPLTRRELGDGLMVWSACRYQSTTAAVILALKNQNRTDAAAPLARALRRAVDAALADGLSDGLIAPGQGGAARVELVAMPSTRQAYRTRGYRPVPLIAAQAGLGLSRPLRHQRQPRDQIGLSVGEREGNLHGALRAKRRLDGRVFLLIDDVVTTGASLQEAARALRSAGALVAGAATVVQTPLKWQGSSTHPKLLSDISPDGDYGGG